MEISVIFPLILLIFGNFRISVEYQYISLIFTDILEPEISVDISNLPMYSIYVLRSVYCIWITT